MTEHADEYSPEVLTVLQSLWGEGFLSPGGEAVDAIVTGLDLRDRLVLDIGCALGGCDEALARKHGARVIGLDLEAPLVERGRARMAAAGLADRVDLRLCSPGPLPLPAASVDVVFGKDSWIHVADKSAFFAETFRVLKPGGALAASDWLCGWLPHSDDMVYFFTMEGLTYHIDTLENYAQMLRRTGFVDVEVVDTSPLYQRMAGEEYDRLRGPLASDLIERLGPEQHAYFVEDWRSLTVVLDKGELRTGRLRARKLN